MESYFRTNKFKYLIMGDHPVLKYIRKFTNSEAEKDRTIEELKRIGYEIKIEINLKYEGEQF